MGVREDLERSRKRAIADIPLAADDTNEALDFTLGLLDRLKKGEKDVLSGAAIELEDYISKASTVVGLFDRWGEYHEQLIRALGENNEALEKLIQTFIMARILQNFDKRH